MINLLVQLYGPEAGEKVAADLRVIINEHRAAISRDLGDSDCSDVPKRPFSEKDVVLIAYGDHLQSNSRSPLATLSDFCRKNLLGLVSTVHILPFHPSTAYDGYAITDYMEVDTKMGSWDDVQKYFLFDIL